MASSPFTRSMRSMTVAELLNHFRSSVNRGALRALDERDADFRREIEALRARCCKQDTESVELLRRIAWLEEELSEQTSVRRSLEENGVRLQRRIRSLEKDESARVCAEKADSEAELEAPVNSEKNDLIEKKPEVCDVNRSKQTSARRTLEENGGRLQRRIRSLEKDELARVCVEKAVSEAMSEKNDQIEKKPEVCDEIRSKKALEAENVRLRGLEKELKLKIGVLEKEKGEIEAQLCKREAERSAESGMKALKDEIIQLVHNIDVLEREKLDMEIEFRKKESEKSAENDVRLKGLEEEKGETEAQLCKAEAEVKALRDESIELVHNIDVLKREKRDMEIEFRKKESAKSAEFDMVLSEKRTLEVIKGEMEEEVSKLAAKTEVLEMEKGDIEAQLCKIEAERNAESVMRKGMELEVKALKDEIIQLVQNVDVLKREKRDMEIELHKKESEKSAEIDLRLKALEEEKGEIEAKLCKIEAERGAESVVMKRMEDEVKALKDESIALVHNIDVLRREKRDMEIEFRKKESAKSAEFDMVLSEKRTLEVLKEGMKEAVSKLAAKTEVLEKEKVEIEAKLCRTLHEKDVLEGVKSRMEGELKEKISQLGNEIEELKEKSIELERRNKEKMALEVQKRRAEESVKVLEKGKAAVEDEFYCYRKEKRVAMEEKDKLIKKITQEKMALKAKLRKAVKIGDHKLSKWIKRTEVLVRQKDDMAAEIRKAEKQTINDSENISTLREALEDQKTRNEDAEKHISKILKMVGVLESEKEALGAKERERDKEINSILKEKSTMEDEHKKKVLELFHMIEGLKREKMELKAKICEANKEKDEEIKRILDGNVGIKAEERSLMEEGAKKILELVDKIGILEREKRELDEALEDRKTQNEDAEKRISKILKTVGVLESEKEALDAKERERGEEINSILKEKMDLEVEKRIMEDEHKQKVSELAEMIEVLKREKVEMGAKFCDANKKRDEEIKRILDENVAMKAEERSIMEEGAKKNLELVDRIDILEREKRELDEEILQKDEVIQVLAQENESLEDTKKELKTVINGLASKLKKIVNLVHPVHHPSNVDMLRTPLQSEGQKTLGNCKRKRQSSEDISRGRITDGVNPSSHVTENVASCRRRKHTIWETDQDLLSAFDSDPELCLEAICALYRQHKSSLPSSKPTDSPPSLGVRGLEPDCSAKVIALAEYLIDEDPEGRMQKSVAELERLDAMAVGECVAIAKQHYKQVFEIYKNKEGPFFLS